MLKWARLVAGSGVFDLAAGVDMARLDAWRRLGPLVAEDLAQLVGRELEAIEGWPKNFGQRVRGATVIPMSMASDPDGGARVHRRGSVERDVAGEHDPRRSCARADDVLEDVSCARWPIRGGRGRQARGPTRQRRHDPQSIPVNDNKVEQEG